MKIEVTIIDRHGNQIQLGQRVAMRVYRCSGSDSSWWRKKNTGHFIPFSLPGTFELDKGNTHTIEIRFVPDPVSENSLCAPMGKEQIRQNVDYLNVNIFDSRNLDSKNVPELGNWEVWHD